MERVKLVAVSGFVYSKKAVDAGASFEATPVDADYLVETGQATRDEGVRQTYQRRDMVATPPTPEASTTSGEEVEADDPDATPPERVAAKRVAAKRTYTRRNLTAEGTEE